MVLLVLREWLLACIETPDQHNKWPGKSGENTIMTGVVPTESVPTEEGLYQDPEETMTQKDNGSVRKKGKVQRALRDRIVLDHLPLVKAIAVRVHENLPVHLVLDGLITDGIFGFF